MRIFLIGAIIVAATGTAAYMAYDSTKAELRPLSAREVLWQERIAELGGKDAYEAFAADVADKPHSFQHEEAHAFGAALFAEEGTGGLPVCDSRFSFGCYHEFLGRAIATLGIESIPALNDGCFQHLSVSPLSCQHGIGHGALAYFGYDDAALQSALDVCRNLDRNDPIGGCYGGVFMEYNVRTMLGIEATPRENSGNPFAPCDALADEFQNACIYWQPQWWQQGIMPLLSKTEQFETMGGYCREFARTPEMERTCFEGIGNVSAQSANFDPARVREICDVSGETPRQKLLCRSIGANHLGIDVNQDAGLEVCSDLAGAEREYCEGYALNRLNIANTGALPI